MVISRSNKENREWVGEALIFSGRTNPKWNIDKEKSRMLEETWDSLEPFTGEPPSPPILGYRGFIVKDMTGNREWFAYGGVVFLKEGGVTESRLDKEHRFERILLESAPNGMLPASFFELKS
ncbi:MAG TPA: hypothetical protein VIO11_09255 [Candidatus Methanoperedens sp.]